VKLTALYFSPVRREQHKACYCSIFIHFVYWTGWSTRVAFRKGQGLFSTIPRSDQVWGPLSLQSNGSRGAGKGEA